MIDIKALEKNEENPFLKTNFVDGYRRSLNDRGLNGDEIINSLLEANKQRKALISESESVKAKQNKISAEIPKLKREGKDTADLMRESQKLGEELKAMEARTAEADEKVHQQLLVLPNMLHHTVPKGAGAEDNRVEKTVGTPTKFSFKPKEHWELGEKLSAIDFERAGKVTGARFAFLVKGAARLERALIQFMMDLHADKHGYDEMIPPFMANVKSFTGTGQFPKFKNDVFAVDGGGGYYLIPTAEVPVTNYFADEILEAEMLPKSFVAYSPCFRSEAGSHGKDTKGLIRQHQFNKVELVKFTRPEESEKAHEELTSHAEAVLDQLELPYRRMTLCSRDIGFGAMKCYDLEVWLPGQDAYREISSCSNFGDFQARRANIRFREGKGKTQFVHTLNGSGLAVGRTLIAIFENFQQEDGSVVIPKALRPYTKIDVLKP